VKHAGTTALDQLEDLLAAIRASSLLTERSRGVFYLKSKAFLHFHEDPAGLFADVRSRAGGDFERIKVDDAQGRALVLKAIYGHSLPASDAPSVTAQEKGAAPPTPQRCA